MNVGMTRKEQQQVSILTGSHSSPRRTDGRVTRRQLLAGMAATGGAVAFGHNRFASGAAAQEAEELAESLTIDLEVEPQSLDPAVTYDIDGWSIVHSVYDSLLQFGPDGAIEPLLAESFVQTEPLIYEIKLRQGISFHNGEPFDARSVSATIAHIVDPETASQVAQSFAVIESVEEVDDFTVRLHLSQPAPWLPSQIAPWCAMLPPEYIADPANDFASNPVGTGPFRFVGWDRGEQVRLEANADYFAESQKGQPIAEQAAFRFVGEASTRVADMLSGSAGIVRAVPTDQFEAVTGGGADIVTNPISGSAWVRVPNDIEPFTDQRVRQALNYAVDIDGIVEALLGGYGVRLANFFVPGGMGYDPDLAPYTYDPDRARQLLTEAGYPDGFDTTLAYPATESSDLVVAIAGQLTAAGIRTEAQPVELATYNSTWQDQEAAPLRFLTWRPLFDPYTLLSLIVSNTGFLSRYDNPEAQALIDAGAIEPDPEARAAIYTELGQVLHEDPAAIYGYELVEVYGVAAGTPAWTPRADDFIIPTYRG
jgi:peptide/nickel transport system substrate-binding protein